LAFPAHREANGDPQTRFIVSKDVRLIRDPVEKLGILFKPWDFWTNLVQCRREGEG